MSTFTPSEIDIDSYNPYPSFQSGQKGAITQILGLHEDGQKIIELAAPTAGGKSLILYILGKALTENQDSIYAVYSTPLVALVNQLKQTDAFHEMPTLKGKRNYYCPVLSREDDPRYADSCPFKTWEKATDQCSDCNDCAYQIERDTFMAAQFGATTLS